MIVITVRNVHEALPEGLRLLRTSGEERASRNGPVLVVPVPVTTRYCRPTERVLFWALRDANPFFHFFEALWMLAGRNDVKFVADLVGRMRTFSDDGVILHGAYGYRWRRHFDVEGGGRPGMPDQLKTIIQALRTNPNNRRCVLTMWDPVADLDVISKDIPCNTQAYIWLGSTGCLDMTICCRSNDVIWGAYGANAVHFSFLQEYLAAGVGVPVGSLWQVSNNYHAYLDTFAPVEALADEANDTYRVTRNPYVQNEVAPYPLVSTDLKTWDEDLGVFFESGPITGFRDPFFRQVVTPMWHARQSCKQGLEGLRTGLEIIEQCKATDWKLAVQQWIKRRIARRERVADDGPVH